MIKKHILFFILMLLYPIELQAQSFRVEDIKDKFGKGKPFKLSGGFSANSTLNTGNGMFGREPFVYYLNGNINLNIYGLIDLPVSFSLTNSGSSYQLPSLPNRLSIHPSYKWITGHIGDVSMAFSPYTLNNHIFTGAGVELKPDGWEFAAMYGRLLKAVEYDEVQPTFLPVYKRMAYGMKVEKVSERYRISVNMLNVKDDEASLATPPDNLGITPMENLTGSVSFLFRPVKFIEINGEYGLSLLTADTRAGSDDRDNLPTETWQRGNVTTSYYNAFKTQLNFVGDNNRFGVGYERIDPDYRTLGAYYFVNDIENITLNAYQSFWQNKANVTASVGYEHDDLAATKTSGSSRMVGSANIAVAPSERININLAYSNFQTYTNVRSSFETINQENQLDKPDTLNFVQLSQSANINLNIIPKITETHTHNLNIVASYQDAANKQGAIYHPGSVMEMINTAVSYSMTFRKTGLTLNSAINMNNSKVRDENTITWGPTIGISSRIKKKITLASSFSYNTGSLKSIKQSEVYLCRINSSYTPSMRHHITFNYNFQWRSALNRPSTNTSLFTLGYSFNF
jgi:hypothetical protein